MTTTNLNKLGGLRIDRGLPRQLFNRFVVAWLRSPLHGLVGFDKMAMVLTYTGQKSGRVYSLPVAYFRQGLTVTTFALFTNTIWWKNLRNNAQVQVHIQGCPYQGVAQLIEEPTKVANGLAQMAAQSPRLTQSGYYQVPRLPDGQIDEVALREMAKARVMIQIRLSATEFSRSIKS